MSVHHRIEKRDAFHVVGLRERILPPNLQGIPALWDRFIRRIGVLPDRAGTECYGVCVCEAGPAAAPGPRPFDYMACAQVSTLDRVPEGMSGFTVPAGTYAVFTHRGPIGTLTGTILRVWKELMPAAGLRPTGAPDFELYDERFKGEAPESELELWIPVVAGG